MDCLKRLDSHVAVAPRNDERDNRKTGGHTMAGLFIAFEGGEGAGKSTQSGILCETLTQEGHNAVLLREPGSTELGDYLRQYLINDLPISPLAELLLFEAARAQLMAERIEPLLAGGAVVIADRFAGSTVAYQGYGRGIDLERIAWLNDLATGRRYPDLTILLDIDPVIGLGRVNERQSQLALPLGEAPDRFQDEIMAFHDNVRRGFLQQAGVGPGNWLLLDGNREVSSVTAAVWAAVCPLLAGCSVRSCRDETG